MTGGVGHGEPALMGNHGARRGAPLPHHWSFHIEPTIKPLQLPPTFTLFSCFPIQRELYRFKAAEITSA